LEQLAEMQGLELPVPAVDCPLRVELDIDPNPERTGFRGMGTPFCCRHSHNSTSTKDERKLS